MPSNNQFDINNLALPKGDKGDPGATLLSGNALALNSIGDVATTASISEQIIETKVLDLATENILTKDGDEIEIESYWTFAANANAKTIKVKIESTTIFTSTGNYNALQAVVKCRVKRIGSLNQIAQTYAIIGTTIIAPVKTSLTFDLGLGVLNIVWTQQNGVAAAADIVSNTRTIYKYKR